MGLFIAEFSNMGGAESGAPQIAAMPPLVDQAELAIGSETKSAAFGGNTKYIRVYAEAACHIQIGATPTATTAMMPLAAGASEYFGVQPGHKLSVIAA